ncbi:DUF452 family protein [Psittacicella hinzii]|uniref:Uncharacterized protein n=1 Tax=Psittacicella hinzii TaxID=2028575 RepID=A0A3A1YU82_9GAMM|nr:DUF452 family protein [Psittacicella hinzii]RIY39994.1 hypothetical protein CKF58_01315 [Psittacicella hinzii]
MLKIRTQTYALTAKFAQVANVNKAVNIVYFHGFTMHDNNYGLVLTMYKAGLIDFIPGSSEEQMFAAKLDNQFATDLVDTESLHKVDAKIATLAQQAPVNKPTFDEQGNPNYGILVTVSFDYTTDAGCSLETFLKQLAQILGQRKSVLFAYSYGILIAQFVLDKFSNFPEEKILAFHRIVAAYGLNGSLLPYDDQYSINPEQAIQTAVNWSCKAISAFAMNMGMPQEQIALIRKRAKNVDDEVFKAQKQTLVELYAVSQYYRELLDKQILLNKWRSFQAATDDKIFPVENLLKLGRTYKLQVRTVRGEHYLSPADLVDIISASTCYEEI